MIPGISILMTADSIFSLPRKRTRRVIMAPATMPEMPLEIRAIPLPPHRSPTRIEMIALTIQVSSSTAKTSLALTCTSISASDR